MGEEISLEDVNETFKLVKVVPSVVSNVMDTLRNVTEKIQSPEFSIEKGISFLDLKNHTMLNYIMNLTYIILQKLSGKKIENSAAVERLAELRIVLEKIKPIDEKLKYQINKLLTAARSGKIDTNNPLGFRANPEGFDDEDEDEHEGRNKKGGKYVPPKITAAYYEGDNPMEELKKRILERSQKKALSSSVLYDLRKEYDTGPEEIKAGMDSLKRKLNDQIKEQERYEEEYMTRMPMTKKQKHDIMQIETVSNFNFKFDDFTALEMRTEDISLKRKSKGKGKRFTSKKLLKKGRGKKRRH